MRVLLVNKRYIPHAQAGPAFSVQYLAEGLNRQGHEAHVLCRNPGPTETRQVRGVTCLAIDETLPPDQALRHAEQKLEEFRPDVVHVYFRQGFPVVRLLESAQKLGCATMHTICTYSYLCDNGTMFDQRRCVGQCPRCQPQSDTMRPINGVLDGVVFVSRFVKQRHGEHGFFQGLPAEDVIWCSYDPEPNMQVRTVEQDPTQPLRLGFLGRIDPAKGLPLLLPTVSKPTLARKVQLRVAGGAPPQLLAERRQQFPRVQFLGFADRVELFRQIDVLVVPSYWEDPLPRVIYEAYAHGIPVIGSKRGGIPEAIDDGATGILFEPTEEGALERILLELAVDRPRVARMSEAALRKAEEFSTRSVVPRYVSVYERCVAAAQARGTQAL